MRLNSPWRSGAIGLRGLSTLSRFSRTTRTWNISSRLSGWTLGRPDGPCFLNRFQFLLSYRSGTNNIKPDALSRAYSPETQEKPSAQIIPRSRIVAPLQWELERVVREAQAQESDPGCGPAGRLYVPQSARARVLQWGHESPLTCHPGNFLQRRFWWPSIKEDVKVYVEACPVCSQGKVTHQRPQGLLHPLPIPHRPWSHLSLDFVTGLPPSQGNPVILVVVDRFSKAARFISLPKLPSAKETAELIMTTSSGCLEFPWISFLTEGPSFHPGSGGPSASWLGAQPAYHRGSIQSLMAKQNGSTRIWRPLCGVWRPITPPLGLPTSYGQSMPTTPSSPRPLGYPPLNASLGIAPHCSLRRSHRLTFPQPGVLSNAVVRPGGRLGVPFFKPPRDTNVRLIAAGGWLPIS